MPIASDLRLTNADIEAMPEDGNRYEIIDGELFVSSAPSYFHQSTLTRIILALGTYLMDHPIGEIAPGVGVVFDEYTGVIPDLVFATNQRLRAALAGGRFRAAPEIVIEILSPGSSNERRDRHVKRNLYASRGATEYWIVDPHNRCVELYRRNDAGDLILEGTLLEEDELTTALLPGFSVRIDSLFA
jgi:Uma2 family endonuclease